jgi:hypothetical protein
MTTEKLVPVRAPVPLVPILKIQVSVEDPLSVKTPPVTLAVRSYRFQCPAGTGANHEMFNDSTVTISGWGDYPTHRKIIAYKAASDDPHVEFGDDCHDLFHVDHVQPAIDNLYYGYCDDQSYGEQSWSDDS